MRLRIALEAQMKLMVGKITVEGENYLTHIPKGKKIIFVTTHISDLDVPVAACVVSKHADIAISNMSIHHSFLKEPSTNIGIRLAGKHNFLPVDMTKDKKGMFNTKNFIPMKDALDKGKAIVIAGHNPSKNWQLSKGGLGAAYLSAITKDVVIIPVTVNIESEEAVGMHEGKAKTLKKRPDARVTIHAPMEAIPIEGASHLGDLYLHASAGGSAEWRERAREIRDTLQARSDQIMRELASSLPLEKRGEYK